MFDHLIHHLHFRHRASQPGVTHPFPSKKKEIWVLDHFMLLAAPITPLLGLSQAHKIWESGEVANLFAAVWFFSVFMSLMWIIYSAIHKAWPLLINGFLNLLVNAAVSAAIIYYS